MKPIFTLLILWAVAAVSSAAEGTVTKNATGTTAATVYFESGERGLNITALDATSDKAGSRAAWRIGTSQTTVAAAAAGTVTNVTTYSTALAANDIVLTQNSAGAVTNLTVHSLTLATNTLVSLARALPTNLAAGDPIKRRHPLAYTLRWPASATETNLLVTSTNQTAPGDLLVFDLPYREVATQTVHHIHTTNSWQVYLRGAVERDLSVGHRAWERFTNFSAVLGVHTNGTTTNLHVATTNWFAPTDPVLIQTANGKALVTSVHNVTATNVTIGAPPGLAITTGDRLWKLTNAVTTVAFPARAGDTYVELTRTNDLASGDTLVFAQTTGNPSSNVFYGVHTGTRTSTNVYTLVIKGALGAALPAEVSYYELTNNLVLRLGATNGAFSVVVTNTSTGLSAGDQLVVLPAAGGSYRNEYLGGSALVTATLNFTTALNNALAPGDGIYLAPTNAWIAVGNTTVSREGAVFSAPRGRPAMLTLDGTSAVSINSVTADYGR